MRTAIILVIAVVWSFSTSAAPLRLQDGFAGHPFETHVELKNGNASMYDKGWNKCGQSSTTEAPAFEFELTQPMDDLDVTVTALAVIVGPDGGFVCGKAKPVRLDRWPAGRWKIFLHGGSVGLSADIFLEQPKRALREAKAAAAAAPTIDVAESATNPSFLPMKLGPIFPRGLSGVTCNKGTETLSPVAQLVVRAERRVDVSADRGLRLVNDKGDCQSNLKDRTLAAGRYTGGGGPSGSSGGGDVVGTAFELSIEDEGRVLSFADAPILVARTLEAPAAVTAKTVDGPAWVGGLGRCSTLTRAPSFYVRGDADNVEVSPWRSPALTNVRFEVVGPLEAQISEDEERRRRTNKSSDDDDDEFDGPRFAYRCDQMGGDTTFRRLKGTYAVFVRAEERGADITLLARRLDRTPDLLTAPIAIPESMPMAERALPRHYPLLQFVRRSTDINGTFPPENLEAFFLDAPRGLFVSVADVPAGTSLVAGEPLLIRGWSKRQARVSRADGTSVDIPTASLVELPATVTLPKKAPKPEVAKDLEGALRLAGPGEKELLESYFVAERKHNACVGAWMKKNDPTWGKSLSWSTSTAARP